MAPGSPRGSPAKHPTPPEKRLTGCGLGMGQAHVHQSPLPRHTAPIQHTVIALEVRAAHEDSGQLALHLHHLASKQVNEKEGEKGRRNGWSGGAGSGTTRVPAEGQ